MGTKISSIVPYARLFHHQLVVTAAMRVADLRDAVLSSAATVEQDHLEAPVVAHFYFPSLFPLARAFAFQSRISGKELSCR